MFPLWRSSDADAQLHGEWWSHHPRTGPRTVGMWHWGMWWESMVGWGVILELFSNLNDSMILWTHLKFIVEIQFQLLWSVVIADHLGYFPDIRVFSWLLICSCDYTWRFGDEYHTAVSCSVYAQPEQMIAWAAPAQMDATVRGAALFYQFCSARKMQKDFCAAIFLILSEI